VAELRAPTDDDAQAIADLFNRCAAVDDEGAMTVEEVRMWLTSPALDPEHDIRVVTGRGRVVGYVDVNRLGDGTRVEFDGRIDPAHRGDPAVARALLDHAECRLGELPLSDGALVRAVDRAGGEAWVALLHERGYREVRATLEMAGDLGPEPPVQAPYPASITPRTAGEGDEAAVHAAIEEGFSDLWDFHPESLELFVHHSGADRSLWFLAEAGEELAGAAVCRDDAGVGWVDRLAVRRAWRRQGIALALLTEAFRAFHARGVRHVRLRVDGDSTTGALQLYERAGLHVVARSNLLQRAL
jgi:mycothiol synthase